MSTPHNYSSYSNNLCRCDICRAANTAYQRKAKARRQQLTPDVHNASTYGNWGCRCDECKSAWSANSRARRAAIR